LDYLPTCIKSITQQAYSDYELIISDDHSSDGTREYLETINHKNIKVLFAPESLSMTEHWEWALSHAVGDWQIFVGQDDGLQSYFFELAEKLTQEAESKNIKTIMSSRAYFFWKGCEFFYGKYAVNYQAKNKVKIHNLKYELYKSLFGLQDYFELPQMYTTSLFHRSLIDKAREDQSGKVLSCHPQDANLAAIAFAYEKKYLKSYIPFGTFFHRSLIDKAREDQSGKVLSCHPQDANLAAIAFAYEKKYLKSYIPFGWVGSSVKSAGMAIISDTSKIKKDKAKEILELKETYKRKVENSKFKYNELAGDFELGSLSIYLWQALLETSAIQKSSTNSLIRTKIFKILLFSSVAFTLMKKEKRDRLMPMFNEIIKINDLSLLSINVGRYFISFVHLMRSIMILPGRVINKISPKITHSIIWASEENIDMINESNKIQSRIEERAWI
jgi:glycosyltransferase involved in cell wall biosynthesis